MRTAGIRWPPSAPVSSTNMSERLALRGEIAARYDHDNNTENNLAEALGYIGPGPDQIHKRKSGFTDGIVSVGLVYNFAPLLRRRRRPRRSNPPPAADCHALDDDHDGVNNCDEPLPGYGCRHRRGSGRLPAEGGHRSAWRELQVRSPEGRRAQHRADAAAADGPTRSRSSIRRLTRSSVIRRSRSSSTVTPTRSVRDAYNQKLSERRAQIVYDYLTTHGIDPSRITAVKGFGESQPIDTNATKEGRARNRRTELKVENPGS